MVTDASKQREQEAGAFSVYIQPGWMSSIKFATNFAKEPSKLQWKLQNSSQAL